MKPMPKRLSITLPIVPESPAGNVRLLNLASCKGGGQYCNDFGDRLELEPHGFTITLHDWGQQEADNVPRLIDFHKSFTIKGAEPARTWHINWWTLWRKLLGFGGAK